jgi:hypothetical protein
MKKVDELTKNRREMDRENISGHMPEDRKMLEYCPVRNFETYLQKLHPQCNRLWQFPKDSFNISDECWFQKRPIGKGTLASFMSTLSRKNRPLFLSTTLLLFWGPNEGDRKRTYIPRLFSEYMLTFRVE